MCYQHKAGKAKRNVQQRLAIRFRQPRLVSLPERILSMLPLKEVCMKEFKIVVDMSKEKPFLCYEREVSGFKFFRVTSSWKFLDDTPSHLEAKDYLRGMNGKFVETYDLDDVPVAVNDEVRMAKDKTYSSSGLEVKKMHKSPNSRSRTIHEGDEIDRVESKYLNRKL